MPGSNIRRMTDVEHEFVIELDAGLDPLSGRVRSQIGTHQSFVGWLGLAGALVRAVEDDSSRNTAPMRSADDGDQVEVETPPDTRPVELSPETAGALAAVHGWAQAFNERDLDRLLALSVPDVDLAKADRAERGHDAVRKLVHLQSYGVAQHVRAQRYIARAPTVIVEALIELRWVDSGELADTAHGVALFDVRDGQISRFRPLPDLATAFGLAGWTGHANPDTAAADGGPNHARSNDA